jgi:predicted nucleic acid-binding Zn ribbon protein
VRSWFGIYPYRCTNCQTRYFLKEWQAESPGKKDKRPEAKQRWRRRVTREAVVYVLALAVFVTILYYVTREPGP